jgi:hypothetical protein
MGWWVLSLAPLGWMATLPVMGYVVGGALSTALVAKTQRALVARGRFSSAWWWRWARPCCAPMRPSVELLAAVRGHGGGRLLQRQRQPVPVCRGRTGWQRLARKSRVAGHGRRFDGRCAGPQPGGPHPHPDRCALCRCLPGAGAGGPAVHGGAALHPLPATARQTGCQPTAARCVRSCASPCSSWPPSPARWALA